MVKMNVEHRNALEITLPDICQDLDAEDVIPYLISKGIITMRQTEELSAILRKDTRNMRLVALIQAAGPSAFQEFINALQICNKKYLAEKIEASSTSSYNSSRRTTEYWKEILKISQQSLKDMYLTRFKTTNPFSLPFTFDIENTWVSLALEEDTNDLQATEDHAELLKRAFDKVKMLVIEGNPATGKTSLMRRLAYEWARQVREKHRTTVRQGVMNWVRQIFIEEENNTKELWCYDLVIYIEFREVREKEFESIAQLVLCYCKKYLNKESYENLEILMNNEPFCKERRILVLLDGYDESSLKDQCSELNTYLFDPMINKALLFYVVVATRKGYLSSLREREGRFVFAQVLGFTTKKQKEKYISNHFSSKKKSTDNITAVHRLLNQNQNLDKLAETPLFLTFICLVHERITDGSSAEALLNLYCNIVWYHLDRYQKSIIYNNKQLNEHQQRSTTKPSVPVLFEYELQTNDNNWNDDDTDLLIQNKYFHFPQLHFLGLMGLHNIEKTVFLFSDLENFKVKEIVQAVGLMRKEEMRNSQNQRIIEFFFPHRTIQEFLAALSFFFSNEKVSYEILESKLYQRKADVSEFRMFLRLFAETNKFPVESTRQQEYLEWWNETGFFSNVQAALKAMYLTRFKTTNPFSLPFTFDIENTWVSLALEEDTNVLQATEDHAELLKRAFDKVEMLIIEGDPATGKTSLMRRLAYEWANRKQELLHYDLVLYAEFREVHERSFQSIADLVLGGLEKYLTKEDYQNLKKIVNSERFCKENRILVLLDGYDESSLEKQCSELSSYLNEKMINKQLFFDIVISTRKGYLSHIIGGKGRFLFAKVLEFTTKIQKEKYIYNHFLSSEVDNKENIEAVHNLLNNNENLNKLAEIPLFLTFICLVHEKIVEGTLLELYCNIIWWLIDRHQQDFQNRNVPARFGFKNNFYSKLTLDTSVVILIILLLSSWYSNNNIILLISILMAYGSWRLEHTSDRSSNDKCEIIQDHYLRFPQLYCLGNMALRNLKKNVFENSDCAQFNLQTIIEQVGLLRKEQERDSSFKLVTSFFFPHRTIQEFLAAFYCLCSNDITYEWLLPDSNLDISKMNEFERFLFRIALSYKMPITIEKREIYFQKIADIVLDITFDAFHTTTGFNNELLNFFLSQCENVKNITFYGKLNSKKDARNMVNDIPIHTESEITSRMNRPTLLIFGGLKKLHSLAFIWYTFEASSQLSITNCPSLKDLKFRRCKMESSTIASVTTLPAIDTVGFCECNIDLATWQSITDQIRNSTVKYLHLSIDFFVKETYTEFLHHLQKCDRIQQIHVALVSRFFFWINIRMSQKWTANLAETAQKLPALTSITFSDEYDGRLPQIRRLREWNKALIEMAGRLRNPEFTIKYAE